MFHRYNYAEILKTLFLVHADYIVGQKYTPNCKCLTVIVWPLCSLRIGRSGQTLFMCSLYDRLAWLDVALFTVYSLEITFASNFVPKRFLPRRLSTR